MLRRRHSEYRVCALGVVQAAEIGGAVFGHDDVDVAARRRHGLDARHDGGASTVRRAERDDRQAVRSACGGGHGRRPAERWCFERVEIMRLLGLRILTQYLRDGDLGPAASISKLYWSEYHQVAANLAMDIMDPAGLVPSGHVPPRAYRTDDPGAPNSTASWEHVWMLNAASGTVYAGTSQVQRTIPGVSMLGPPREPRR